MIMRNLPFNFGSLYHISIFLQMIPATLLCLSILFLPLCSGLFLECFLHNLHLQFYLLWQILISMDILLLMWCYIISASILPFSLIFSICRISQCQLPQLSANGAIYGRSCLSMVFPLFDRFPMSGYVLDSPQFILWCHFADVFLNASSFVQDSGFHTYLFSSECIAFGWRVL